MNWLIKAITSIILCLISIFNFLTGADTAVHTTAQVNGSLVCTDSLGRSIVSADGEGEKLVGVFYFLWLGQHGRDRVYDNTKIVSANPDAINSEAEWLASGGGMVGESHFWGEPLWGYYTSDDEWVFRKHVQMLTDADVDFIVIDTTNAFIYEKPFEKLLDVWHEYYLDGWDVPKIAFYTNSASGDTMNRIFDSYYNNTALKDKYPRIDELWFRLDSKPMIVGDENDPVLRADVKEYFNIKASQWPYAEKNDNGFPWMEFDRSLTFQAKYNYNGTSIMNVSVAQHSDTVHFSATAWYGGNDRSRTYHNGENDMSENALLYGHNFAEQWEFAIKMNPDIIFVTGFNEWTAQRQPAQENEPIVFVDCADENNSRDVDICAGEMGDNYYLQMVKYISEFKKTTTGVESNEQVTIDINGGFDQWKNEKITAIYKDYENDTADRNAQGFGGIVYTDDSGRNDIVNMKVCEDEENYYFYVDTAQPLTPSTDKNWMTLFINEEYAVNRTSPENSVTAVEKITDSGYEKIAEAKIYYEGNQLMICVKKSDINSNGNITFKWADNYAENDVYSFYTKGDSAPLGRLCYSY